MNLIVNCLKTTNYVNLQGDNAIWSNAWDAAGKPIVWDMIHYDVQLIGGVVLHQGKIAEMHTGEGKTLVATLPVLFKCPYGKRGTLGYRKRLSGQTRQRLDGAPV